METKGSSGLPEGDPQGALISIRAEGITQHRRGKVPRTPPPLFCMAGTQLLWAVNPGVGTTLRPNSPVRFEITNSASWWCSYGETPVSTCIFSHSSGPSGLLGWEPIRPTSVALHTIFLLGCAPQGHASAPHPLCSWGTQAPYIPVLRP